MSEAIKHKLQKLQGYEGALATAEAVKLGKYEDIVAPVADKLKELDEQYDPIIAEIQDNIDKFEKDIKEAVLEGKESVTTPYYQVKYSKGRVSWDTKALSGFAAAHPEMLGFMKQGRPSVSIVRVNK